MKSKQEILNKVADHLKQQDGQCNGPDGCAYYGQDDFRCAIGCLLPDERPVGYYIWNTSGLWSALASMPPSVLEYAFGISHRDELTGRDRNFLNALQDAHDEGEGKEWPNFLRKAAADWDLDLPPAIVQLDAETAK